MHEKNHFIEQLRRKCSDVGGQAELAKKVGISKQELNDVLHGRRQPPEKLTRFMNVKKRKDIRYEPILVTQEELDSAIKQAETTRTAQAEIVVELPRPFWGSVSLYELQSRNIPTQDIVKITLRRERIGKNRFQWQPAEWINVAEIDYERLNKGIEALLKAIGRKS